ncbi:enoyl-CoA hydratase/isomerase family protein [Streptomyces sp. W16]|uniref:enoyl-CoA hydratase/isomerase family protein n=1 Tax=Streptomyces sp. W16 TaxID=3076631 RepID=UPI00295BE64C|nr:enoyl-CoA hydratase/isomerase family protein [Streptomyces sp. W16]MDV9170824.1 enoyl-CoA hydratase/isomerase family protein [Streptomyces sp. W16]
MSNHSQFDVHVVSPSYWKVTFENAPMNLIDLDTIEQIADLVTRIEQDPDLNVVVFQSANPDFFMAHLDLLLDNKRAAAMPAGPSGLPLVSDNLLRLSKVPAVTISAINGRVRGAGSEFVLSTDIRFAGPGAVLGQPEIGIGAVPGGNPMGRLAELVGRGRAMEIILGGDDFPAQLAAEYGYVNRVLPEGELDDFVDTFARRIAGFEKPAVSGAKEFVDAATTIPASDYAASLDAFRRTASRPESADRVRSLFARGFQQPQGIELDLGRHIAEKA